MNRREKEVLLALLGEKKRRFRVAYSKIKISVYSDYLETLEDRQLKYIGLYGGRGSIKTYSILQFLVKESFNPSVANSSFVLGREIKDNIDSNLRQSFIDVLNMLDTVNGGSLLPHFDIKNNGITNTQNNVKILFRGFRVTGGESKTSQIDRVKGFGRVAYLFIDEAAAISDDLLNALFPSVNRQNKINGIETVNDARLLFAWNRAFLIDPIHKKLLSFGERAKVLKRNIFDLPEEFQDKNLLEQAEAERGEHHFDHTWMGEPYHAYSGLPFYGVTLCDLKSSSSMSGSTGFLDLSFKGGDYTSLSIGKEFTNGKIVALGFAWKRSWAACITDVVRVLRQYGVDRFYYEENGQGIVPRDAFYSLGITAIPHTTTGNKEDRIYAVGYKVKDRLRLYQGSQKDWLDMVVNYSSASKYDDAPDSLTNLLIKMGVRYEKIKLKG